MGLRGQEMFMPQGHWAGHPSGTSLAILARTQDTPTPTPTPDKTKLGISGPGTSPGSRGPTLST